MIPRELTELTEVEKRNKIYYLNSKDKILFSPLSFEDYSRIVPEEKDDNHLKKFYEQTSLHGKGLTIAHNELFEKNDIFLSLHPRYALPILHNHEFIEIVYVLKGNCLNYIEGNAVSMHQGDFCFMAPSAIHALLVFTDEDIVVNIMLWKESFKNIFTSSIATDNIIARFIQNISLSKNNKSYMLFRTRQDCHLQEKVLTAYQEIQQKNPYYLDMVALKINEIFIELLRKYAGTVEYGEITTKKADDYVFPIINFIQENYQSITLENLASIFAYSETYLSKLIKKNTGKTFKKIVEEARIADVKRLLLTSNLTLTQISQRVGYFDSSHMTHSFIKAQGISPKKWLEQQNNLENGTDPKVVK